MEEMLITLCRGLFNRDDITLQTKREDIEEWDSLGHIMLIAEAEALFKKKIPFDQIDGITSLQMLDDILEE